MRIRLTSLVCLLLIAAVALAGETPRVEVRVERMEGGDWAEVEPNRVLEAGDKVRFQFQSSFDGYLYVMNHGSGGQHEILFPRRDLGRDNRVMAGRKYNIPGRGAWFKIEGPPGYEVTLWLVTPSRLGESVDPGSFGDWPVEPRQATPDSDLRPRCDDGYMKNRGVCVDPKAGPQAVTRPESLPKELGEIGDLTSRDLRVERDGNSARIYPDAKLASPVLYEFRLAHK